MRPKKDKIVMVVGDPHDMIPISPLPFIPPFLFPIPPLPLPSPPVVTNMCQEIPAESINKDGPISDDASQYFVTTRNLEVSYKKLEERVMLYQSEHQCAEQEARRIIRGQVIIEMLEQAESMADIAQIRQWAKDHDI